ncbi:MAG: multidrug ABC transporter [Coprobacillus sp.]|nr:multidrug ABC transporter [Coprobacillus sp.]
MVYFILLLISVLVSSLSQVVLKIGSNKDYSGIYEYLNIYVISGYFMLGTSMILNVIAYTHVEYIIGVVIATLNYILVAIFSKFLLKEDFTKNKLIGMAIVIFGVFIANMK